MSPFEFYLRTGRRRMPSSAEPVEVKFNPWHDPANGRFTFAQGGSASARIGADPSRARGRSRPDGSWGGGGFTGGGGGTFGGGGASSHEIWPIPSAPKRQNPPAAGKPTAATIRVLPDARAATEGKWHAITRNGYTFQVDAAGRTREVTGSIRPAQGVTTRSRAMQSTAGGSDRLRTDDGGHYIAYRFDGPRAAFNHFAQDSNVNRGRYRVMEDDWAKAMKAGKKVEVDIKPLYHATSKRPDAINIVFYVDGKKEISSLPNRPRSK